MTRSLVVYAAVPLTVSFLLSSVPLPVTTVAPLVTVPSNVATGEEPAVQFERGRALEVRPALRVVDAAAARALVRAGDLAERDLAGEVEVLTDAEMVAPLIRKSPFCAATCLPVASASVSPAGSA